MTFNGNSFDLPVLRYRAMIHAVSAPGLAARPYFNRYSEDTVDLCDILSSFAPHTKPSLNELSRIMGLPGPAGIGGNDVERYFLEGRIKEIADYCETDVVNTYRVWLRHELFRGRLTESEHQASERHLVDVVAGRASAKAQLRVLRKRPETESIAIEAASAPLLWRPSSYPERFFSRMLKREKRPLGDLFDLRNFGVNLTLLHSGGESALLHRHSKQDEFVSSSKARWRRIRGKSH